MSVAAQAREKYGHHARALKTPRDIEYEMLARVTGRIQNHLNEQTPPASSRDMGHAKPRLLPGGPLIEALNENRRLWAAFATDLADTNNALPDTLRAKLFSLAEFTLRHTSEVILGKASADVLVEINTAVMRGLRANHAPESGQRS